MMDSRHIPYLNAIIAAKMKGKAKFTLMVLLDSMDFDTCETYIGQQALADKMGVSYSTVARGLDLLEKLKLIQTVGIHPNYPGASVFNSTTVYRILLEPVVILNTPPVFILNTPVGDLTSNHIYLEGGFGGTSAKQRDVVAAKHTYTAKHAYTSAEQDTPYGVDQHQSNTQTSPLHFTNEEIGTLSSLWFEATHLESTGPAVEETIATLASYPGPLTSDRLATLMFFAFRMSDHWSNPKNWRCLDMENFLRTSSTLEDQLDKEGIDGKPVWHFPKSMARFTAKQFLTFLIPPVEDAVTGAEEVEITESIFCSVE